VIPFCHCAIYYIPVKAEQIYKINGSADSNVRFEVNRIIKELVAIENNI
jgi:hypothetical protein